MKVRLICLLLALVSTACSNRYRTSDPGLAFDDMKALLRDVPQGVIVQSSGGATDLADDPNTTFYFADAYAGSFGPFGTVDNVLAFTDRGILGIDPSTPITGVRVFFLDNEGNEPRNQLIVGVYDANQNQWTYKNFSGTGSIDGGEFVAQLSGDADIVVRSFDTDGSSLNPSIQLKVFDLNGGLGGKFPVLSGYR